MVKKGNKRKKKEKMKWVLKIWRWSGGGGGGGATVSECRAAEGRSRGGGEQRTPRLPAVRDIRLYRSCDFSEKRINRIIDHGMGDQGQYPCICWLALLRVLHTQTHVHRHRQTRTGTAPDVCVLGGVSFYFIFLVFTALMNSATMDGHLSLVCQLHPNTTEHKTTPLCKLRPAFTPIQINYHRSCLSNDLSNKSDNHQTKHILQIIFTCFKMK